VVQHLLQGYADVRESMSGRWSAALSVESWRRSVQQMKRKEKGFSLLELLIVVMIVLIIAAIAIPNLLRSRMSANEASAVSSMRTIVTSEIIYSATFATGFSGDLPSLSDAGVPANCIPPAIASASSACLIESVLASGTKSGYLFTYVPGGGSTHTTYTLNADPISSTSGQRHFYTDDTHVLRVNASAVASPSDPPL
jgi:type IV pilus assembly protein PilA